MPFFTHHWRIQTWQEQADREGLPLNHLAGGEFRKRGVAVGDYLYPITVIDGAMYVMGRMRVDRYTTQEEGERELKETLWPAPDHVLSYHCTPMRYERQVPTRIVERLRFGDNKPLKFTAPGFLDQQTLRGVRQLTPESAELLDSLIDEPAPPADPTEVPKGTYPEGATKRVVVDAYERNPAARRACIAHYGTCCQVCGFDFGQTYGELGEGFIHVHHLNQLSEIGEEYQVDPVEDLRPVCPNCHAMLHQQRPPLSIAELVAVLRKAGRRRQQRG